MRSFGFGIIVLVGLGAADASAQSAPSIVSRAIAEAKTSCERGKTNIARGFMTTRDINGDGIADYILDYGSFNCSDGMSPYCGSAGCLQQVFASYDGSYIKVLDDNVQDLKFKVIGGRPAMQTGMHGTSCGRRGSDPCGMTLYWNGSNFSAAK